MSGRVWCAAVAAVLSLLGTVLPCAGQTVGTDSVLRIGPGCRSIAAFAYAGRGDIKRVEFAPSARVAEVGEYAFWDCANLEEVVFGESVRSLGEGVLKECGALRRVVFPKRLARLPKYCCAWDTALTDVRLPQRLEDIGSHAFAYCSSLVSMPLPGTVRHIGCNVWSRCSRLEEMEFPASVTELESYALSDCVSLRRVVLPPNRSLLGELLLSGCTSLREVVEMSPQPPSYDCDSQLFEPDSELWRRVRLVVPPASEGAYRRAPGWRRFWE